MTAKDPFHLAFPVHSLLEARRFYVGMLGCVEGRSSEEWIDFNFYPIHNTRFNSSWQLFQTGW